jgi:cysteine desulfurase family protein (TIGR01976 family)
MPTHSWDEHQVRLYFPALALQDDGQPRLYADAPGGTQMAKRAIDCMTDLMVNFCANDGGVFRTSDQTVKAMAAAHDAAAVFYNCDSDEVLYGLNTTSVLFHFASMIARDWHAGDNIVLTRMDHDANVAPWLLAAESKGVEIRWLEFDLNTYHYQYAQLPRLIDRNTKFVACNYASNFLGTINNVSEIIQAAKTVNALTMVDAVQAAAHLAIDVKVLGCDLLASSPYKYFGPHAGLLYVKRDLADRLTPLKVRPSPREMPYKHAPGTPSFEAQAGCRGAIEHLIELGKRFGGAEHASARDQLIAGFEASIAHESKLSQRFLDRLRDLPNVTLYGSQRPSDRVPTFSFEVKGHSSTSIAKALAAQNIFVWCGSFYAYEIAKTLGIDKTDGVVRIGFAHYNTLSEVEKIGDALEHIVKS